MKLVAEFYTCLLLVLCVDNWLYFRFRLHSFYTRLGFG